MKTLALVPAATLSVAYDVRRDDETIGSVSSARGLATLDLEGVRYELLEGERPRRLRDLARSLAAHALNRQRFALKLQGRELAWAAGGGVFSGSRVVHAGERAMTLAREAGGRAYLLRDATGVLTRIHRPPGALSRGVSSPLPRELGLAEHVFVCWLVLGQVEILSEGE